MDGCRAELLHPKALKKPSKQGIGAMAWMIPAGNRPAGKHTRTCFESMHARRRGGGHVTHHTYVKLEH